MNVPQPIINGHNGRLVPTFRGRRHDDLPIHKFRTKTGRHVKRSERLAKVITHEATT
jgi:hypothetical protein